MNQPVVRERTEELERASLSTWATLAGESKGRDGYEEPDPLRTAFQSDRDRILHSDGFRALKHKTHVRFGEGHRRTRATHALEVAAVGRTIGRALRLNEDLIEAIALGHDVGNTAFGDAGAEALSMFTTGPFRHEEQSLRMVERLANDGAGLNLTWEVRDGILNHPADTPMPSTLEGQAVRAADRIVAATLDWRDAARVGLLSEDDLPAAVTVALGATHEQRLATMIGDVVAQSTDQLELAMSARIRDAQDALLAVLRDALAGARGLAEEHHRAVHCLSSIAVFLLQHPDTLPGGAGSDVVRMCDLVAALTDRGAVSRFSELFLPSV